MSEEKVISVPKITKNFQVAVTNYADYARCSVVESKDFKTTPKILQIKIFPMYNLYGM